MTKHSLHDCTDMFWSHITFWLNAIQLSSYWNETQVLTSNDLVIFTIPQKFLNILTAYYHMAITEIMFILPVISAPNVSSVIFIPTTVNLQFRMQQVTGPSSHRLGFNPSLVHVVLVVDEKVLGQVFLQVFHFAISIIPPALHTHSFTHLSQCYIISVTDSIIK
jgi:hypothetical protein